MKAMFPGSFNPIHNGHIEIIKEASQTYEKVYIFVANNETKTYARTLDFRKNLVKKAVEAAGLENVEVIAQNPGTLTPLVAKDLGVDVIVRGTRSKILDEYEDQLAHSYLDMNMDLAFHFVILKGIEVSSSLVNEEVKKGNSISHLVPESVEKDILLDKFEYADESTQKGKLVIFCGPSGSGKGTVEKKFLDRKDFNFHFSVSATTRPQRDGEQDGVNYYFLTTEEFETWIAEEKFYEYATFADNYYGTPIGPVVDMLNKGQNVFLEIELQGVQQLVKKAPNAITIFLSPPSIEELGKRLRMRDTESEAVIQKRLNTAKKEMKYANDKSLFKYNVINDNVDRAANEIIEILKEELNV